MKFTSIIIYAIPMAASSSCQHYPPDLLDEICQLHLHYKPWNLLQSQKSLTVITIYYLTENFAGMDIKQMTKGNIQQPCQYCKCSSNFQRCNFWQILSSWVLFTMFGRLVDLFESRKHTFNYQGTCNSMM